ncbi:helix-turn-helix domain-containing protein [Neomegalonema sp.]|uniref:helix-turn-helix domain-containing protein n=1 Tax=Neomegalonema sp. TaxID=2039713 RepID=UPI00261E99F7|nr:helix-turn-helix domain-containing protein [Neomegalonema sp.]MDD2870103.1 helix-turn-helix domain-containing protein [Neomegalonema sp.]
MKPSCAGARNDLPSSLRLIAEVAGREAAVSLAQDYGGSQIYINARLDLDHPLVRSIGMEAAASVLEAMGPGRMEVPLWLASHNHKIARRIVEMLALGRSEAQIARALGCHIRTVRRHRARQGGHAAQMDLFALLGDGRGPCAPEDFRQD